MRLLGTLEACACPTGLLPEQVWDADDIPERELFRGRASGSAMPLVWAHAEHAKLVRSLKDGRVFDMPPQTVQRYQLRKVTAPFVIWRFDRRRQTVAGKNLRIEVFEPAMVHWSSDQWQTTHDLDTKDTVSVFTSPTCRLPISLQAARSCSRFFGGRLSAGRGRISKLRSWREARRTPRHTACAWRASSSHKVRRIWLCGNTRVPRVRALTTISDRWLCQRVGQHLQQQMHDDLL